MLAEKSSPCSSIFRVVLLGEKLGPLDLVVVDHARVVTT